MIDAVNVPVQTVTPQGSVLFNNTRILTGCSARHEQGSGRFVVLKPGIYAIFFGGNVSIPTGGAVAPIQLDLTADGEAIAGSRMMTTPAAVATPLHLTSSVLVRVYCDCCVSLGVKNSGTGDIAVQDANFVVIRES